MEDGALLRKNQVALGEKLSTDVAKSVKRYFADGGHGLSRCKIDDVVREGFRRGAIAHAGDNLELAALLSGENPGYLKCFIKLGKSKPKLIDNKQKKVRGK